MADFAFLYRGGDRMPSPNHTQEVMQKWMEWFKALAERGHLIDHGQPLETRGKIVQGAKKTITDGPFAETKDVVGGFTLIRADSLDEACELAKVCPLLEKGGQVEVRPVLQMTM